MNTFKIKKGLNNDWCILTNIILGMVFELFYSVKEKSA